MPPPFQVWDQPFRDRDLTVYIVHFWSICRQKVKLNGAHLQPAERHDVRHAGHETQEPEPGPRWGCGCAEEQRYAPLKVLYPFLCRASQSHAEVEHSPKKNWGL